MSHGVLSDVQIEELCTPVHGEPVIAPFERDQVREIEVAGWSCRAISFGTCSYGYDLRLSPKSFRVFHNAFGRVLVDPKNFDERLLIETPYTVDETGTWFVIPGNSYALAETAEYIRMPRDLTAVIVGKSTYARCGLVINVTPLEAGWAGVVTLEISNACPVSVKVYADEGICQALFFRGAVWPRVSYADRLGKYNNQTGLTLAKV